MITIDTPERFPSKLPLIVSPLEAGLKLLNISREFYFSLDEFKDNFLTQNPQLLDGRFHIYQAKDRRFYLGAELLRYVRYVPGDREDSKRSQKNNYLPLAKITLSVDYNNQ